MFWYSRVLHPTRDSLLRVGRPSLLRLDVSATRCCLLYAGLQVLRVQAGLPFEQVLRTLQSPDWVRDACGACIPSLPTLFQPTWVLALSWLLATHWLTCRDLHDNEAFQLSCLLYAGHGAIPAITSLRPGRGASQRDWRHDCWPVVLEDAHVHYSHLAQVFVTKRVFERGLAQFRATWSSRRGRAYPTYSDAHAGLLHLLGWSRHVHVAQIRRGKYR
mmetsp:Transcript_10583/g.38908  ORF Transcript_10583/g.38908 Transcript_10583/m.38908 type:complete len:217 (-) Transcript_10583:551-1201(-)